MPSLRNAKLTKNVMDSPYYAGDQLTTTTTTGIPLPARAAYPRYPGYRATARAHQASRSSPVTSRAI